MQTLELECPSCSELLELDVGFAGGVCRCSNCGTLMTVPDEAGAGPETLTRPDRPDDPSAMSGGGESVGLDSAFDDFGGPAPTTRPESPAPSSRGGAGRGSRSSARGKTKGKTSGRGKSKSAKRGGSRTSSKAGAGRGRAAEKIEAGDYRTASGKIIHLDRATEVPMAPKRRQGVRIATGIIFMGIVFAIAAAAIVAVIIFAKPPSDEEKDQLEADRIAQEEANRPDFDFNLNDNPVTIPFVNVLGLPMTERTAVVIDASGPADVYLESLAQVMGRSLDGKPGKGSVAIFAATPNGVQRLGHGMAAANTIKPDALATFFTGLDTAGSPDVAAGITTALRTNPTSLVLVVPDAKAGTLEKWTEALNGKDDLLVHVVLINGFSRDLSQWHRDRDDGEYIELIDSDLTNWLEDADDEANLDAQ